MALALVPAISAQAAGKGKDKTPTRPNVIFIYADDLGFGDLECYGAKNVETPNVNRLAANGIRFTNGYATAATSTPSRYSMLTGKRLSKIGTRRLPLVLTTLVLTIPI